MSLWKRLDSFVIFPCTGGREAEGFGRGQYDRFRDERYPPPPGLANRFRDEVSGLICMTDSCF